MPELSLKEYGLLRTLHALRYLRPSQIRRMWFRERTKAATENRLSQMVVDGLLERTVLGGERATVLRLGSKGIVRLSEVLLGDFQRTEPVSPVFLPHLLDTNEVFIALAGVEWEWARLPFRWRGSHRVHFRFPQLVMSADGGVHRRRRLLVPDALVTPALSGAPICFLELDRSTECVSEGPGRSSIVRKLNTYNAFIAKNVPGRSETAYEVVFKEQQRPPRVVFVVASNDLADRRRASILKAAHDNARDFDVRCVRLDDLSGIRQAFALSPGVPLATSQRLSFALRPSEASGMQRLLELMNMAAAEILTDHERLRWKWLASNVARALLPADRKVPGLIPVGHTA
jgi:hypothetical protein